MSPGEDEHLKEEIRVATMCASSALRGTRKNISPRAYAQALINITASYIGAHRQPDTAQGPMFVDSCVSTFRECLEECIWAIDHLNRGQLPPKRPRKAAPDDTRVSQELEKERARCEAYHRRNEELKQENERLQATMRHLAVTLQALAQVPNLPTEALAMLEGIPENLRKAARPGQVEKTQPGDSA